MIQSSRINAPTGVVMTEDNELLDDHIAARINGKVKSKFLQKCGKLNKNHADVLRNMIVALNDGRLTIKPTDEEQELLS
tara:strand:- start:185 stop:421 length:237 start_codon:yes stop_codon:yes gene_type:complete